MASWLLLSLASRFWFRYRPSLGLLLRQWPGDADPLADRSEMERLYRATGHFVLRRCVQVLGEPEEAMDATQWTYLRAIETGFVVRSRGEALSWLYRTAVRRCLWVVRNRTTRSRLTLRFADDLVGMPQLPIDVDVMRRDLVHRALRRLDDQSAEIAIYSYAMGFGNERVAELCSVSVRTVGRARSAFESALQALASEEGR